MPWLHLLQGCEVCVSACQLQRLWTFLEVQVRSHVGTFAGFAAASYA